jgi:SOS-response transcriptional repressor LexA
VTEQEKATYKFIKSYIKDNKTSPTLVEIANALDLKSKSNAHRLVASLVAQNVITKGAPHQRRSLELVKGVRVR